MRSGARMTSLPSRVENVCRERGSGLPDALWQVAGIAARSSRETCQGDS
jgi:hypothetical protein